MCIPRDFLLQLSAIFCNILLDSESKYKGNFFIFSPILMRHGAVYAAYRALSPVFYRSFISGLVSSNASTNCSQNQVLTMLQQAAILIFLIFSLISVHVYPNLPMNNIFVVYNHNADSFASKAFIFDRFEAVLNKYYSRRPFC